MREIALLGGPGNLLAVHECNPSPSDVYTTKERRLGPQSRTLDMLTANHAHSQQKKVHRAVNHSDGRPT